MPIESGTNPQPVEKTCVFTRRDVEMLRRYRIAPGDSATVHNPSTANPQEIRESAVENPARMFWWSLFIGLAGWMLLVGAIIEAIR